MLQDFNCWSQVSISRFLLVLGSPALDTMLPVFLTSAEGKDHLPKPAGNGLSNAVQKDVGLLATRAHWWLMVSLVSTGTTRASSVIWPLTCAVVVIPPQVLHSSLWMPWSSCQPISSFCRGSTKIGCINHSLAVLMSVYSVTSSRLWMKMISIGPWGSPTVTSLWLDLPLSLTVQLILSPHYLFIQPIFTFFDEDVLDILQKPFLKVRALDCEVGWPRSGR